MMLKRKWEEHKLQKFARHLASSIRIPVMEQWVNKVRSFSSQYKTVKWAADQIIGAPKVYPWYGDHYGAWAQSNPGAREFIELEFVEPVYVSALEIYETLNAGTIHRISALDRHGTWLVLWTGPIGCIESSRKFKPTLKECLFATNVIKLELNCTTAGTWCEIDAVKLIGIKAQKTIEDSPERTKVADDLSFLLENTGKSKNFADVLFIVSGQEIPAHRSILAARNDYFRALFNNSIRESHTSQLIYINNLEYGVFKAVMQYIYCGRFLKEEEFDSTTLAVEDLPERTVVADALSILLENTGKTKNFADVLFIVSGQEIPAHRCILSARSDYFRAMFSNNMRESHTSEAIHINSVECGVFKAVMQYIYCGKFLKEEEFDSITLFAVIRAADMFLLDGLMKLCRYLLNKSLLITTENVCEIYSEVSGDVTITCLEDIKKACLEFMATHLKKISRRKAFSSLPKDVMLEILQQVSDEYGPRPRPR